MLRTRSQKTPLLSLHSQSGDWDDAILIHSVRPWRIPGLVGAFLQNQISNCRHMPEPLAARVLGSADGPRRQLYLVISDNHDDDAFQSFAEATTKTAAVVSESPLADFVEVDWWSVQRQKQFFAQLAELFPHFPTVAPLFRDAGQQSLKGIRGVQNRSVVIADYVTRNASRDIIYHRLDDDMVPFLASWSARGTLCFDHGYNVFSHKAIRLSDPKVRVLGSKYSIDSAGPICDLLDGLRDAGRAASILAGEPSGNAVTDGDVLPERVQDFTGGVLTQNAPLLSAEVLRSDQGASTVCELLGLLKMGCNHFSFDTIEQVSPTFMEARDTLPGGFVSFRRSTDILPDAPVGHQDVLFSVLEHAVAGGVFGDLPIGHVKAMAFRRPLVDALCARSDALPDRSDLQCTIQFIALAREQGFRIAEGLPPHSGFWGWRYHGIKPTPLEDLAFRGIRAAKSLSVSNGREKQRAAESMRCLCRSVLRRLPQMEANHAYELDAIVEPDDPLRDIFASWHRASRRFGQLRYFVRTTPGLR
jgi:hypothetical protein